MFSVDSEVSRTYRIYMPADKIVAGYAVEACWEPPIKTPVTNPLEDFPITANQTEAYLFKLIVNNREVITDCSECCGGFYDCSDCRVELGFHSEIWKDWDPPFPNRMRINWPPVGCDSSILTPCDNGQEGWYDPVFDSCKYGNGTHRLVAYNYRAGSPSNPPHSYVAYDVWEYTVDDPSQ